MEPWKRIVCSNKNCMAQALDLAGNVKAAAYILPEIDNETLTQFTCPLCGTTETWGVTRRKIAKTLYERLTNA